MSNLHAFFVTVGTIIFITLFLLFLAWLDELWKRRNAQRQELVFRAEPRMFLSAVLGTIVLVFILVPLFSCFYYFGIHRLIPEWVMLLLFSVPVVVVGVLATVFFLKKLSKGIVKIDAKRFSWEIGREKGEIIFSRPFKINFSRTIRLVAVYTSAGGQNTMELPTAICDIEQDGKVYSFYYDAPFDEVSSFPETKLRGVYLFQGGKLIMDRIKERHYELG